VVRPSSVDKPRFSEATKLQDLLLPLLVARWTLATGTTGAVSTGIIVLCRRVRGAMLVWQDNCGGKAESDELDHSGVLERSD